MTLCANPPPACPAWGEGRYEADAVFVCVSSNALAARLRKFGPAMWCGFQKHWHGATPTTAMTHIAIQESLKGKNVDWMEHVGDEQYRK
jgi:hypothetical protein